MKKCFFLVSSAILLAAVSQAQNTSFGLKGGVNLASIKIKDGTGVSYDNKTAWHAGALAHIHVSEHFAVQPEVVYSAQGGQYRAATDYKASFDYLNVPILAQYMFNGGFRLETGPQVGFLLKAETQSGENPPLDVKDQVEGIDYSWVLGASYLIGKGFGVDARYNQGLHNVSKTDAVKNKNRVWQFGVFYQFMK
jgi:hypothetical protein